MLYLSGTLVLFVLWDAEQTSASGRQGNGAGVGLRLNQLLGHVARNLDGFLDRAALRHKALHLIAGGKVSTFRQLSM
jgi:hypothetical protein